ncbi:metal ABC transporter permease, partial [Anoxybacillus sp. LAT_38]|nr:metal ABC transporter permease [Anoxybacillus sp. LAT_38]
MDRLVELLPLFYQSFEETVIMVGISLFISTLLGIPLGVLLVITRPDHLAPNKWVYHSLNVIINVIRSLPFIILMVAIIPFTEFV